VSYTAQYEDQQSYSPTFNAFAKQLADQLTEQFNLRDKDILEIGCGKGDFLRLLCSSGGNRGTGIDPSISRRQIDEARNNFIKWIPQALEAAHSQFPADFVCCRHTLEHIHNVKDFARLIREVIGDRDTALFVEVPDTRRVLADCAFEDIYYEHCSYFTADSLAFLLRAADFEITREYRAYADQYLMVEARPAKSGPKFKTEKSVSPAEILTLTENFSLAVERQKNYWNQIFDEYRDQPIALWGSGSKCVSFLSSLRPNLELITLVDINPHRHGKFLPGSGLEIRDPVKLSEVQPQLIVAMNSIYLEEIQATLSELSVSGTLLGL
jgi:SAM-dependent methyltransferase